MRIITNTIDNKVTDILRSTTDNKICLGFFHGLGDLINFLPLFEELKRRYSNKHFTLGFNEARNYSFISKDSIILNTPCGKYSNVFDVIFILQYLEPPREEKDLPKYRRFNLSNIKTISKPYLCNELEIGLKNFEWKPFSIPFQTEKKHRIGLNFFGRPSNARRDIEIRVAEKIWREIEKSGYEPFEIQMFSSDVPKLPLPSFISSNKTIRNIKANLQVMGTEINKCKYVFGIDSGVIFYSGSILGFDKIVGLERLRRFNKVLPIPISLVDIENYQDGSVIRMIEKLDKSC